MEEPYLPPPAPSDNPAPAKKSSLRTIMWWALLIVVLCAIYNIFGADSGRHHAAPPPCTSDNSAWWASWLPLLLVIGLFVFFIRRQFKGAAQFNLFQEPGLLALADGQLETAAAVFRATVARYQKQSQYREVARFNLAAALLRQGNLAGAVEETVFVEKGAGLLWASDVRLMAATLLAELYALRGQVDAAGRWAADARKRLAKSVNRTHSAALLRLSESVLACRQGRFEDAVRGLERDWRQLEGTLAVSMMRKAWLMRAYGLSQLGGPRGEGAATPYLMMLRSQPPGALEHLAVEWPELRTFLVANSLSGAA